MTAEHSSQQGTWAQKHSEATAEVSRLQEQLQASEQQAARLTRELSDSAAKLKSEGESQLADARQRASKAEGDLADVNKRLERLQKVCLLCCHASLYCSLPHRIAKFEE
jgi:uncharacterized protein YydD (DUF2326 family)